MTVQLDVLAVFNCLVVREGQKTDAYYQNLLQQGVVLDFIPDTAQRYVLEAIYAPLPVETLFTREERENAPLAHLIFKQILHYVEVYGLNAPGLFDLTTQQGTIISMNFVRGVTVKELEQMVQTLLYMNAPVKDAPQLQRIIDEFRLTFDINSVANNELRVLLWNEALDPFTNGDDVVRYMCVKATDQSLLIKSKEVIAAVASTEFSAAFFEQHTTPLAQVFNRHKRLILAAKNVKTANAINRIARRSKTLHKPVRESIVKTFIHKALMGEATVDALKHVSTRDKMKYLNVLAQKRLQSDLGLFKIRNGKIWYREGMKTYTASAVVWTEQMVLDSLAKDLVYLKGETILLDKDVDYGLPISRKQTLGRLPFGTVVTSTGSEISSGMYWENAWGAHDLDLSGVDLDGNRVGWGDVSGYTGPEIIFSGDVTSAPDGAMEFLTSKSKDYGIVVNIYSGENGAEMELVVGRNRGQKQWMDDVIVREKHALDSRNCLLGFVRGKTFTVYGGRMNNRRISGVNLTLQAMKTEFWTVQRLLSALNIGFDVDRRDEIEYGHDLSYEAFSFDKLEALFKTA